MIDTFVDTYMNNKELLREKFATHPNSYRDIVKAVIEVLAGNEDWKVPDPERIHEIDDGDYQGTLVYVIAEKGYQPSTYWAVTVDYGSCSGCDTLESIKKRLR